MGLVEEDKLFNLKKERNLIIIKKKFLFPLLSFLFFFCNDLDITISLFFVLCVLQKKEEGTRRLGGWKRTKKKTKIIQFHIMRAQKRGPGKEKKKLFLLMEFMKKKVSYFRSFYMRSVDLNFSSTASGEASEWSVAWKIEPKMSKDWSRYFSSFWVLPGCTWQHPQALSSRHQRKTSTTSSSSLWHHRGTRTSRRASPSCPKRYINKDLLNAPFAQAIWCFALLPGFPDTDECTQSRRGRNGIPSRYRWRSWASRGKTRSWNPDRL